MLSKYFYVKAFEKIHLYFYMLKNKLKKYWGEKESDDESKTDWAKEKVGRHWCCGEKATKQRKWRSDRVGREDDKTIKQNNCMARGGDDQKRTTLSEEKGVLIMNTSTLLNGMVILIIEIFMIYNLIINLNIFKKIN